MRNPVVQKPHSAFTLIELLIVVAIIGILAAIAVPNFLNARIRAKVAHSQAELRTYLNVHKMYFMDIGDLPGHYDGKEEHCPYVNTGYISGPLTDPFMYGTPNEKLSAHEGMYHSTHFVTQEDILYKANPKFYEEWLRGGSGYVIFGTGPAGGAWIHYNPSNGVRSDGMILGVSIRGKGTPTSNLRGRKCN